MIRLLGVFLLFGCSVQAEEIRVLSGGAMCEFTNKSERGGTFTFDVSCGGPLPMQGSGSVVHTAQTIEGSLELKAKDAAFHMQTLLKGRRLGPC